MTNFLVVFFFFCLQFPSHTTIAFTYSFHLLFSVCYFHFLVIWVSVNKPLSGCVRGHLKNRGPRWPLVRLWFSSPVLAQSGGWLTWRLSEMGELTVTGLEMWIEARRGCLSLRSLLCCGFYGTGALGCLSLIECFVVEWSAAYPCKQWMGIRRLWRAQCLFFFVF